MSSYNSPENYAHVKSIAETIEKYAVGEMYRDDSGEVWSVYTTGESYESEDTTNSYWEYDEEVCQWGRTDTGETSEDDPAESWERLGICDYMNRDIFNIEYRVSSPHDDPKSVCIMVACGGPNIYVDTDTKAVELHWWGDRASYPLSDHANAEIDEYFTELWQCQQ